MGKLFGTDGLRGIAEEFPLDKATVELLGRVLYFLLLDRNIEPELIVGRDTRESGPAIFAALQKGFSRVGGKVDDAGILPTPALAFLARNEKKCAVSITASHNAYRDNGIKIFGPDGYKISEAAEMEIEPFLLGEKPFHRASSAVASDGSQSLQEHLRAEYCSYLTEKLFPGLNLHGMKIALDCANGALYEIAPHVLGGLGAEVRKFHCEPDGKNINERCGSLHPDVLFGEMKDGTFDCGFTFDGDGDRCLVVHEKAICDGDFILASAARYLKSRGELKKNAVVATSMSNWGLELFLNQHGIQLYRVPVGDKNVLEKLQKEELSLGGEQSGHIIFMNDTFIGDGLLTALQLLRIYRDSGVSFWHLWDGFEKYPQVLLNIPVRRKPELSTVPEIQERILLIEKELNGSGRIVVRYSGTEMLARVMLEGTDQQRIEKLAQDLAEIINKNLNL